MITIPARHKAFIFQGKSRGSNVKMIFKKENLHIVVR